MTSIQTPEPKDFEKDKLLFNPVLDESINKPDETGVACDYSEKEEVIVDPNSDSDKKPEGFYISKRKAMIGAATLAAVMIAAGAFAIISNSDKKGRITTSNSSDNPIEENETSANGTNIAAITDTEAIINPTESTIITSQETTNQTTAAVLTSDKIEATASSQPESNRSQAVKNIVESFDFNNLSPEQQETIKKYEELSVEDFRNLPIEEQLLFADFVFSNYKPTFDIVLKSQLSKDELKNIYYTENPTTPEQIVANYSYLMTMVCNVYEIDENGILYKDRDLGKKIASLIKTITESHNKQSDYFIDNVDYLVCVPLDYSMIDDEYKLSDDKSSYVINTIMHSNEYIAIEQDAEFSQKTFTKQQPYADIYGNQKASLYVVSLAVGASDNGYIDLG